jgi:two-component system, LytTR family, response regulator LytT
MRLRAYIVDDEPLARDELKYLLNRSMLVDVIGEGESIDEALSNIIKQQPDVVFLDIGLVEESGLSLAEKLLTLEQTPDIVFATAYDEYALKAFELNAVDYLLKPFDEERVQQALAKLMRRQRVEKQEIRTRPFMKKDQNEKLAVSVEDRIILVNMEDIVYIESTDGGSTIHTTIDQYKVSDPLIVLERKVSTSRFLRVHRSYIVNVDQIVEIEPWFNSTYNLHMKDVSTVPVSRTYVKELKQVLGF